MTGIKLTKNVCFKIVLFLFFLTGALILGIEFAPWLMDRVQNPEDLRDYLRSYGSLGLIVFVLMQATHVLLIVIPGDLLNICGGYIYGVPLGFALSLTGTMLGTVCAFNISRYLGSELLSKVIPAAKIDRLSHLLNSTKGVIGILIICLIPGIPKDLMIYVAGLTPIKAVKLFTVYGLSRIPGTLIWVSVGSQLYSQNTTGIVMTSIGIMLLAALGIVMKMHFGASEPQAQEVSINDHVK